MLILKIQIKKNKDKEEKIIDVEYEDIDKNNKENT